MKQQCLRHYDGNPDVDPACSALTLRLNHYLTHQYNQTPHESLKQETPWATFHNDARKLRFVENQKTLNDSFVLHEKRYVANDNIISVDSIHYEVVRGHAGTTVIIQRNVRDNTLSFIDKGRLIKLTPVDLINNARDRRARNNTEVDNSINHNRSSADIAFNQDVLPIVDADGGFTGQKGENNE